MTIRQSGDADGLQQSTSQWHIQGVHRFPVNPLIRKNSAYLDTF